MKTVGDASQFNATFYWFQGSSIYWQTRMSPIAVQCKIKKISVTFTTDNLPKYSAFFITDNDCQNFNEEYSAVTELTCEASKANNF